MSALAQGSRAGGSGQVVAWAFTGREGGVSRQPFDSLNLAGQVGDEPAAVRANRERAGAILGLGSGRLAVVNAVHGAEVAVIEGPGEVDGVDALVTTEAGLGLLALAADCVPLALLDVEAGMVAAAHCGWKGIGAGIVPATVACMRSMGATAIEAVIGPSACARCYPVHQGRIEELRSSVDSAVAQAACLRLGMQWHVDVAAGVRVQLAQVGVPTTSIDRCTVADPALYSYRREPVTGRHGVLIAVLST